MIRALTVFVAAACGVTAQTDAGLDLWVRVREHIRATAAELPNYSCQETMERSIQSSSWQIEFRERLRKLPAVKLVEHDGQAFDLEAADAKALLLQVMHLLVEVHVDLTSLEIQEPNLERVFLHLTGRALRD